MSPGAARRWWGALSVAVGIVGVAVAVGLAPFVAKDGSAPVQVVAVLLAVAGAALLVLGVVATTRGWSRWRRLGTAAAVVVGLAVVTMVVAPAVAATNVPATDVGADPGSVGLRWEDVELETADGVRLAGWYVPSANRAAVVLRHGAGSTRSDVLDEAAVLAGAGFGVLLVDARGHGESDGRAMDLGWWGDADVEAATDHLLGRPDVDPGRIGIVGLSMGGEEAVGASGSNPHLRAVVAEGATGRMAADDAWYSDAFGLRGWLQEGIERLQDGVTGLLTEAPVPISLRDAVEASDARYLLVTAGGVPDEARSAAYVAAAAPERVEVWTVPGAGHTDGLATAPDTWADRVVGFLTDTLLRDF